MGNLTEREGYLVQAGLYKCKKLSLSCHMKRLRWSVRRRRIHGFIRVRNLFMDNLSLQLLKFFIYCRKSSEQEDRQILSLPAQEKELRVLADREKLHVVDVYLESRSAHTAGRPLFDEMLRRIEKGDANGIIVWDESRIARNALDSGRVIYMIDLEQIKAIVKP